MSTRYQRSLLKARRRLNIERQIAVLGDGSGEVHDRSIPGNLFVRFPTSAGTLGAPVSLPIDVNANVRPDDGLQVEVGWRKGRQIILGLNLDSLSAAGINPIQLNPADPSNPYVGPINQDQIMVFKAIPHPDVANKPLTAIVLPGLFYVSGVPYVFGGGEIDLTSLMPSAGEHCFASIFIKTDLTLEAFGSTAIADADPLTDVDLQEADALKTVDSYPAWAWELRGDDTALSVDRQRQIDLRNFATGALFQATALTAQLTTITFTAPGTPDYAVQDFTQTSPWGFASHDEANSVLAVIANLQTRMAELETQLQAVKILT